MQEFITAMEAAGCGPASASDIKDGADSKLIRAANDSKSSKSLYYSYRTEGDKASGRWYSCKSGEGGAWFSKSGSKWSAKDKLKWKQKRDKERAEREAELLASHEDVAKAAETLWKASKAAKTHPYLTEKGIKAHGLRINDGNLLVPLRGPDKRLWLLQTIMGDGAKFNSFRLPDASWAKGGRKQGCYHSIAGKNADLSVICICEGYATGASIHEATGFVVVVALDAGNLKPVALAIREKYPEATIIICADNDR